MGFHHHSANVRCLTPEQVVHLQYYTNSLLEDDLERSSQRLCPHHDPYYKRPSEFAFERNLQQKRTRKKRKASRAVSAEPTNTHLPLLSDDQHHHFESWASELDRLVLDFCCAMVDRQHRDATLIADPSSSKSPGQIVEPYEELSSRRQGRSQRLYHC